jgi:hypothetical protein
LLERRKTALELFASKGVTEKSLAAYEFHSRGSQAGGLPGACRVPP